MHSYLINLDRSPDRLRYFTAQATAGGIPFERIRAIDGRELDTTDFAHTVAATYEFQPIDAGYVALFMTHKQIWQQIVDSQQPHAAVFEDDAVLASDLRVTLDAIDRERPEFDVIKLETTHRKVVCGRRAIELASGNSLQTLRSWHGGTAGYVISRQGAQKLLQLKDQVSDVIDQVMFNPLSRVCSQLNVYQLNPAGCIQKDILDRNSPDAFGTTIDRGCTKKRLFRHGVRVDLLRFVKKQQESARRRQLARDPNNVQLVIPFASRIEVKQAA